MNAAMLERSKTIYCRLALLCMLVMMGCKSDCNKLCSRQQTCVKADKEERSALHPDKQVELCVRVCEAAVSDPRRSESMKKGLKCADKPCSEFKECLKAVE